MVGKTPPEIVERIQQMRTDGMSGPQIAAQLTAEGVPTVQGKPWHPSTITSLSRGSRPLVFKRQPKWFPECFDSLRDYLLWKEASRSTHGYCNDCETAYRAEMTEKGRCRPVFVEKKRPGRTPSPAARRSATRRVNAKC